MIVDSSAVVAILSNEPERTVLLDAMLGADAVFMSAATYAESAIVVDRRGDPVLSRRFDEFLAAVGAEVVAVSPEQARIARAAYRDFGKGTRHPAALNFGDCFSYALAIERDHPLLFVGEDFVHTNVRVATREAKQNGGTPPLED